MGILLTLLWLGVWFTVTLGFHHRPDQFVAVAINGPVFFALSQIIAIPSHRSNGRIKREIESLHRHVVK